ncbi:MAG: AraC-like DNA-binding protein [Neolewinella sp.]|jgi:AraC-like DNA-binding protein
MPDFFHIKSVSQVHDLFGLKKPLHPLITIVRKWPEVDLDFSNVKLTSDLYLLSMKGKMDGTSFRYGRNSYDFEDGTLVFLAPNQVISFADPIEELDDSGWSILFHPDLIRKAELGKTIKEYCFFKYEVNEALHLSGREKQSLIELVEKIALELSQNIDRHSQDLIIQNLETIFKYSTRYYDRQFYTRTNLNKDYAVQFEKYLERYFSSNELAEKGIPSITQCGEALNMSGPYLSDLLKLETGRSAKDHIHAYLIEKAKTSLLKSKEPISEIAFNLGFEYPQHFSKLFKSKTGTSPSEYRNLN